MAGRTQVSIEGDRWLVNGRPTYQGRSYRSWPVEGLLLNSRMVNGIFDDENPLTRPLWRYPDTGQWDPERNTREFVEAMPLWRERGLMAFTLNLQGGSPLGYYRPEVVMEALARAGVDATEDQVWAGLPSMASQPWHNSAFDARGRLKEPYLRRLARILDRADELGMVVILGLFYQGQDERLEDEAAVVRAVEEACGWVLERGYSNVVVEICNECSVPRYEHEILRPHRVHELIERAQAVTHQGRRLLVSVSYGGGRVPDAAVARVADFLLMHGNGVTEPDRIARMVEEARALDGYRSMPVLFNEDDHYDFDKPWNNFLAAISRYAGWGYFDPGPGAGGKAAFGNYRDGYQNIPVDWGINTERKEAFFRLLAEVTGAGAVG